MSAGRWVYSPGDELEEIISYATPYGSTGIPNYDPFFTVDQTGTGSSVPTPLEEIVVVAPPKPAPLLPLEEIIAYAPAAAGAIPFMAAPRPAPQPVPRRRAPLRKPVPKRPPARPLRPRPKKSPVVKPQSLPTTVKNILERSKTVFESIVKQLPKTLRFIGGGVGGFLLPLLLPSPLGDDDDDVYIKRDPKRLPLPLPLEEITIWSPPRPSIFISPSPFPPIVTIPTVIPDAWPDVMPTIDAPPVPLEIPQSPPALKPSAPPLSPQALLPFPPPSIVANPWPFSPPIPITLSPPIPSIPALDIPLMPPITIGAIPDPDELGQADPCQRSKKDKKKRKERTECYQGIYTELRSGLIKKRRRKISCQ